MSLILIITFILTWVLIIIIIIYGGFAEAKAAGDGKTSGSGDGRTTESGDGKTTGSENARDGAHPYQVSLRHRGTHICGGSIVDEEGVITAAHCVNDVLPEDLTIVVGSNQLDTGGVSYQVLKIDYHEDYSTKTHLNDTAILKVERIAFNEKVSKIAVEKDYISENVSLNSTGWGSLDILPNDLQFRKFQSTNMQKCIESSRSFPIVSTHICAITELGAGVCPGDSGGPLAMEDSNGTPKLVGVTSWGNQCTNGPDVFARVASYIPWYNEKCNNCLEY